MTLENKIEDSVRSSVYGSVSKKLNKYDFRK